MDPVHEEGLPNDGGDLLSAYTQARATTAVDDYSRLDDEHDDFMNPSLMSDIREKFTKQPQHTHHTPLPTTAALDYIEDLGQHKIRGEMESSEKSIAWADIRSPKSLGSKPQMSINSASPAAAASLNIYKTPLQKAFFSSTDRSGLTVSLEIDLALKKDALENITERESIIQRLHQLKFGDPMTTKTHVKR